MVFFTFAQINDVFETLVKYVHSKIILTIPTSNDNKFAYVSTRYSSLLQGYNEASGEGGSPHTVDLRG